MKLVISAYGARLTLEEKESATYGFAFKGDDIAIRDIVTAEFDCYLARVGYHAGAPELPDIWRRSQNRSATVWSISRAHRRKMANWHSFFSRSTRR